MHRTSFNRELEGSDLGPQAEAAALTLILGAGASASALPTSLEPLPTRALRALSGPIVFAPRTTKYAHWIGSLADCSHAGASPVRTSPSGLRTAGASPRSSAGWEWPSAWRAPAARAEASRDARLVMLGYWQTAFASAQLEAVGDRMATQQASKLQARLRGWLDDTFALIAASVAPDPVVTSDLGIAEAVQSVGYLQALCLVRTNDRERAVAMATITQRIARQSLLLDASRALDRARGRPEDERLTPDASVEHALPRETRAGPRAGDDEDPSAPDEGARTT